ncbi:MAG: hypothetical protein AABX61_01130 [Nanoarchaeota archaeon]
MPIKTGREEAWQENFLEDVKSLSKAILVELDKNLQLPVGYRDDYNFNRTTATICLTNDKENKSLEVRLTALYDEKARVRWKIAVWVKNFLGELKEIPEDKRVGDFMVNISYRDEYTRQELGRAKKQILTKIYEFLNL